MKSEAGRPAPRNPRNHRAHDEVLLQGNEAIVEGALRAGCRFFAGYPITPATEISEILSVRLPAERGTFIQMEDEIASMGAIIGASLAGVKSMTATSGPGFSLMQENLGFAVMAEVPCVVVNVMRGGPSTGLPTLPAQGDVMQARWGTHGDHPVIALAPSTVLECFELTIRAFNLAERFRNPVILLLDEVVAHMREKVVLPPAGSDAVQVVNRVKPKVPPEWYVPYEDTPIRRAGNGRLRRGLPLPRDGPHPRRARLPYGAARRDRPFHRAPLQEDQPAHGGHPPGRALHDGRRRDRDHRLRVRGALREEGRARRTRARHQGGPPQALHDLAVHAYRRRRRARPNAGRSSSRR